MFRGHKPKSGYSISEEAIAALQSGDTQALIDSHRARFGGWRMEGEDDDDDDAGDGDDNGGDSGTGDGDDDGEGDSGSGDDDDTKAELAKMRKRMEAADRRASEAEKRLKEQDDAKKDDLTKAQDRVTELEGEVETLRSDLSSLRLENAFLTTNKHTWHKPGAALKLAQSEGYLDDVVKDDGTVDDKAMEKALDKMAKENAYLVKTGSGGSSGESGGGRSGNGKDDKAQAEADKRRAPALARRG